MKKKLRSQGDDVGVFKELMLKDYVTLSGTILGTTAILMALLGAFYNYRFYVLIATFLWGGALCADLLDGWVARKLNQVNEIGKEIDSLSDGICFVAAPGVIIFSATLIEEFPFSPFPKEIVIIGIVFFVFCGIIRLAWFNVANTGEGYTGLVTPMSATILILVFVSRYHFNGIKDISPEFHLALSPLGDFLCHTVSLIVYMIILGVLNLSPILKFSGDMQKKRGIWVTFLIILGVFLVIMIILASVFFSLGSNIAVLVGYIFPLGFLFVVLAYVVYGFINYLNTRKKGET